MRDYRKLRAFELADMLAIEIYRLTRCFPKDEQFGLTSQMRRAAVSVASNIVEGCSRHTEADFMHFIDMAYASSHELKYQLSLAHRLQYIGDDNNDRVRQICEETSKVLSGLLRSFRQND